MKGSTGKKVISVFIIGLMLLSGISAMTSVVDSGRAATVSGDSSVAPASVSAHAAELKENVWLNKIDPSLRDGVNADSKGMVKVTILTRDMGAVNPIISRYLSRDIEGKSVSPSFRTNTRSDVPVTKTVTVPYSALKEIASAPGVMGIYKYEAAVPADIDNLVLQEAQQNLNEMKVAGTISPQPMDYTTPVEHHADEAWSMGYEGDGVNVAVVDTGVDFANPDLVGQWAVDNNPNSSYYGWPIMWDPVSMDLLDAYFTASNDWDRMPYPIFASYGESSWYSDTSYTGHLASTPLLVDVDGNSSDWPTDAIVANDLPGDLSSAAYDLSSLYVGDGKDNSTGAFGWFVGFNTTVSASDNTTYALYIDTLSKVNVAKGVLSDTNRDGSEMVMKPISSKESITLSKQHITSLTLDMVQQYDDIVLSSQYGGEESLSLHPNIVTYERAPALLLYRDSQWIPLTFGTDYVLNETTGNVFFLPYGGHFGDNQPWGGNGLGELQQGDQIWAMYDYSMGILPSSAYALDPMTGVVTFTPHLSPMIHTYLQATYTYGQAGVNSGMFDSGNLYHSGITVYLNGTKWDSTGNYTIDYAHGTISYTATLYPGSVVKADYSYNSGAITDAEGYAVNANASSYPEFAIYFVHDTTNDSFSAVAYRWDGHAWDTPVNLTDVGGAIAYNSTNHFIEAFIPRVEGMDVPSISIELFSAGADAGTHAQDTVPSDGNVTFNAPDWSGSTTTLDNFTTVQSSFLTYSQGHGGYWTKRYDPNGYGNGDFNRISRDYYVGDINSASGNYHLGIAKDDRLTQLVGERVGMLVVDSTTPGVYDTVYVDLNNNLDFTDDKPVTKDSPLSYEDLNGDGEPDISGGLLYFIANTQGSVSGEVLLNETAAERSEANLSHGHVVTEIGAGYSLYSTLTLNLNDSGALFYLPFYSEPIYQDIVLDGDGVTAGSSFFLNGTSLGLSTYKPVIFNALTANGFGITAGSLELYYTDANGDEHTMTESKAPGFLNYTFDPVYGNITILFDMEAGSSIYALYQMDTYTLDFTTGVVSFMSDVPENVSVIADYDYGLSLPYSDTYAARMGYDNFIPASGDLVAFFGDFDLGEDHGTFCASSVVGTWASPPFGAYGTAPAAKIIGIGDFYAASSYDAWYFAVEGYDGIPDTGDEAQIVSNSFGSPGVNSDGWNYGSRLAYHITTEYAPNATFVVAAGNDGWGYGTVTSPGSAPGVVTAGAGVSMAYRWLFGYDGGEPGDWMNYLSPDTSWYGDVTDFSGRGPTALGTPDPDVLAVGEFAMGSMALNNWAVVASQYGLSIDGLDAWDLWAGTSLATPVTAGVLALVYQSYYVNHNNTWPSAEVAKKLLTSSCDDHGYDPLQQGAGWVNASLAVQMAAELNGVSSDTMYWTPGDYHGQKLDASVHLIDAGDSDSTEISFTNYDQTNPATVDISDAFYKRTGEYTFNITTNIYDVRIIEPDGVYLADGTRVVDADMASQWNNADFMKITAYTEQDGAYPYMELSDWIDREHYGGNETAFYSPVIDVVNETIMTGQYGETHATIPNLPLVPASAVLVWDDGHLLVEGLNYTLDRSTGDIAFMQWGSVNHEQAFNSSIFHVDNETVVVGHNNETSGYLHHLPLLAGESVYVYSNETLLTEGVNYTLDSATGEICFIDSTTGVTRPLEEGEVINATYTYYVPVSNGDSYELDHSQIRDYTVWLTDATGNSVIWPADSNYTVDATHGTITLLTDLNPGDSVYVDYLFYNGSRPLANGEVVKASYSYYVPVNSGATHKLRNYPVTSYTVYLNESGTVSILPASDYTLDSSTGGITINRDLNPGDRVTVDYNWQHVGIYDGPTERIRMNVNLRQANLVSAGIYDPASRVDDGIIWSMKDVNFLFLGAAPKLFDFKVTVEFYQKADWSWIDTNLTSLTIPPGGNASITATIDVPADAAIGAYEGSIVYEVNGHTSIIPVLVNVPATTFPVHFGGNVPTTSLYENGAGMGGYDGGASGDWRFYFVDVDNLKVDDARKLLMMEYWNNPADDWEMYLFGAEADPYGFSGGQYGGFRMVQVAGTKDAVGITDTLVPGSEILHADMMSGPFEIAVRGMAVGGQSMMSEVHGDFGYMSVSPNTLDIYTSETSGSVPVTVYSDIDLYGGVGSAVTYSETREWDKQPVDPYPYPGGSFEAYLAASSNEVVLTMPEQTVSATFTLYFYNGANDVDMGIFYDANGDGVAEADEIIVSTSQTATAANPEVGSLMFPPAGTYIIKAAGYDVAPGSLFDLTVQTLGIGESAFSAVDAANTTIPAGTPSTFGVGWDFGDSAPAGEVKTLMLVSPGAAPYALVLPIDITLHYDPNAPAISSPTPPSGATIQAVSLISVGFEDSSPIDTKLSTMSVDGMDVSSQVQFTSSMVVYNARGLSDGLHTVSVKLVDEVGNVGTYSWGFTVDSTPPELSVSSPEVTSATAVTITGSTEPTASVTINGEAVTVSEDGTFSYEIAVGAGQTLVDVIATDLAGNTAEVTRTITMDETAPGVTVVVPAAVSGSETVISGIVSGLDSEIGPVTVTINGVPVAVNSDGTFALPVTLLEGENTFTIVVTDAAGNSYSVEKSIILDSTAPTLSVGVPSSTSSGSVSLSGTASGASKVFVNGKQVMLGTDGAFTSTISVSPGSNLVVITAVDAVGNSVEKTYTVNYMPENLIPVVSASAPSQSAPTLTSAGGMLAAVLFIIGLIIGFLARMVMGGGGRPEEETGFYGGEEEMTEPAGIMEGVPADTAPEEAAPEAADHVDTPAPESEEVSEETPPLTEPEEPAVSDEPEEPSDEGEEEEDKGEVLDLTDI